MPNYATAYDVWRCEPPDNSIEEAAQQRAIEAAAADYVQDWIDGSLYDDGEVYSGPIERLTEDDWLVQVLAAKDDEELLQAARIVQSKLRQFVEEQAEEIE